VAPSVPTVVVVARAVVTVVVDALSSSSGHDGVPSVAVGPKTRIADAATLTSSPRSRCCDGCGLGSWADGTPTRPRSKSWCEAELSACCATATSSRAFSYWRTRRSLEVAGSGQPRSSMAATARFWDARRKSGGASASVLALASTFTPSLARRLLSRAGPRAGGVGVRPCG
jgi:hypothetical protein